MGFEVVIAIGAVAVVFSDPATLGAWGIVGGLVLTVVAVVLDHLALAWMRGRVGAELARRADQRGRLFGSEVLRSSLEPPDLGSRKPRRRKHLD